MRQELKSIRGDVDRIDRRLELIEQDLKQFCDNRDAKMCPFCAERIQAAAKQCG